jgi:hypothetical protein
VRHWWLVCSPTRTLATTNTTNKSPNKDEQKSE